MEVVPQRRCDGGEEREERRRKRKKARNKKKKCVRWGRRIQECDGQIEIEAGEEREKLGG